jgi:transcriptional regulator with XRE-family HTH domain
MAGQPQPGDRINQVSPGPGKRKRGRRAPAEAAAGDSVANQIDVGRCLRGLRIQRGLTLRLLADQSGLNVNTLSMIENGKTSPSVATLQILASALDSPITAFFETGIARNMIAFHKANRRPRATFAHGTLEDLGAGMISNGAEPFLVVLEPNAESGSVPIVHTGREFVFCLEGLLAYTIENQEYLLEPGDSLLFEAHLPHHWKNAGASATRSLLVLCPSDNNDRPTNLHFIPETGKIPAV